MDGIRASLSGIQNGLRRLWAAAAPAPPEPSGAPVPVDRASFSERAIELLRAEHEVAVNARALRRQDEAQDALMDLLD